MTKFYKRNELILFDKREQFLYQQKTKYFQTWNKKYNKRKILKKSLFR